MHVMNYFELTCLYQVRIITVIPSFTRCCLLILWIILCWILPYLCYRNICFTLVLLVVKGLNDHFNFNWLFIHLLPPGAPVKIENLPFKRKAVNDILDDPKPGKWRDIQILCVMLWWTSVLTLLRTLLYDTFFLVLFYKYVL